MENAISDKKNISWIGIVKSIGIYLVFLGHIWSHSRLTGIYTAIYSFHMPMFFILSGYLFSSKDGFFEMTKKKLFRVFLPGVFYNVLFSPLYFLYSEQFDAKEFISGLFFFRGEVVANPPCWFFYTLFFTFIVAKLIRVDKCKNWINLIICAFSFGVGYLCFVYVSPVNDYFGVKELFPALAFFSLGKLLSSLKLAKYIESSRLKAFIFSVVFGVIWFIFGVILNKKIAFYGADFGNYLYFVISGIFGTLFLVCLVIFLTSFGPLNMVLCKIEKYPSNGSLLLIGTHYTFMMMYVANMSLSNLDNTLIFDIVSPIFIVVVLLIYYPVYRFCSKRLPFLTGEYVPKKSTH